MCLYFLRLYTCPLIRWLTHAYNTLVMNLCSEAGWLYITIKAERAAVPALGQASAGAEAPAPDAAGAQALLAQTLLGPAALEAGTHA